MCRAALTKLSRDRVTADDLIGNLWLELQTTGSQKARLNFLFDSHDSRKYFGQHRMHVERLGP